MPVYEECGCRFMLDVLAGTKKLLDRSEITEFQIPRYSEFSLESLMSEV